MTPVGSFDPDTPDPGLAAERTDLAWDRSGLSLLACGVAVMRGLSRPPLVRGHVAVGASIFALGACTWALGAWRLHRVRAQAPGPASGRDLAPVALGVTLVGVGAFVIAALFPG